MTEAELIAARAQVLSNIRQKFANEKQDPLSAKKVEQVAQRLNAAAAFDVCREEIERIYTDCQQHYNSDQGLTKTDLDNAHNQMTALLGKLRERIEVGAMADVNGAISSDQSYYEHMIGAFDSTELSKFRDLISNQTPPIEPDLIRSQIFKTRAGVTEVLWETATIFGEVSSDYVDSIPKETQDALLQEFTYAKDFSSGRLDEASSWLEKPSQDQPSKISGNEARQ